MFLFGYAESPIQLVPDGTIVFHLAVIIVMVALLNATLLRPINRILEERERLTKGRFSQAQQILIKIDEMLRGYERTLRGARTEGYELLEHERDILSRERELRIAEVGAEIARELSEQRVKLRIEMEHVKVSLRQDARTMALEISKHILHRPIIQRPDIRNGRG